MTVEEKFYLLVMDEVRAQPGLANELAVDLERHAVAFAGCPLDQALGRLEERKPCANGRSFAALRELGPQPPALTRDLESLRSSLGEDGAAAYERLCREALLNLLWQDFGHAEDRINLAKYLRDDWAFAHYLYGLQRGLEGHVGKAHFELYLAVNRETFPGARSRIERALDLVR